MSHLLDFQEDGLIGLVHVPEGVKCLSCGKVVASMRSAKRHYQIMHATDRNDRNFKCPVCAQDFAVASYLSDHMRKVHRISQTMLKTKVMP